MAISRAQIEAAPDVSHKVVTEVLGKPVIHTNAEAMLIAEHVKSTVFKVGERVYVTDDTKLEG